MKFEVLSRRRSQTIAAVMPAVDWWGWIGGRWIRGWWRRNVHLSRRPPRRLRLCESVPLGDRRFVAVVEFENSRFLLGGTAGSLVLLARLKDGPAATPPRACSEQPSPEQPSREGKQR